MLRFLIRPVRRMKFRTKILCVTGVVALIPIVILVAFCYNQIISLQEREIHNTDLAFEQNASSINQIMDSTISNTLRICTNKVVSGFFSTCDSTGDTVLNYITKVRPYIAYCQETASPYVKALRFYTKNPSMFSNLSVHNIYRSEDTTSVFDNVSKALGDDNLAMVLLEEGRQYYSIEYSSQNTLSAFSAVSAPASNRTLLECELSFDSFFQTLKASTNNFETTGYTMYFQTGQIIFSSDPEWAAQAADTILDRVMSGNEARHWQYNDGARTLLINAAPVSSINCVLVSHSDLNTVFKPVRSFQTLVLILVCLCVVLCGFLATTLINSLLRRADTINEAILQIQEGNFNIAIPVEGTDFIDQVATNLNGMAAQINDLIHNNYENQLKIKDLQIRMLSQQISPHFLYNTLECLRMKAVLEDNLESAQALLSLGRLLRYYAHYFFESAHLSKELEVSQDYINIMSLLEERDCILEMDVPPELMDRTMPRFILQPILENSIKHAERPPDFELRINLSVKEENGVLHFCVTDNGMGVPPEQAAEIQQRLLTSSVDAEASIGLYNTNARIKLLYGEEYGISFSSVHGTGTSVTITTPSNPPGKESAT